MISKLLLFCLMMLIIIPCSLRLYYKTDLSNKQNSVQGDNSTSTTLVLESKPAYVAHRKLLQYGSCTNRDMSISQSKESTSGIPQYIVQIINTCSVSNCAPSNIHFHCGWFASARIVNPRLFKRLSYDDCLVNGGKAMKTSHVISFTYSNSFMYPLTFKSAKFC